MSGRNGNRVPGDKAFVSHRRSVRGLDFAELWHHEGWGGILSPFVWVPWGGHSTDWPNGRARSPSRFGS